MRARAGFNPTDISFADTVQQHYRLSAWETQEQNSAHVIATARCLGSEAMPVHGNEMLEEMRNILSISSYLLDPYAIS